MSRLKNEPLLCQQTSISTMNLSFEVCIWYLEGNVYIDHI